MQLKLLLPLVVLLSCCSQAQNKYGLHATTLSEYKASIKTNPEKELVELKDVIPGIVLDIHYATTNNFTGASVYGLARAYARKPVAEALQKAQTDFNKLGYGIKIYDAYRPYSATIKFYELMKGDTTYVANPYKGSRHNRGCALDMTIVDFNPSKN